MRIGIFNISAFKKGLDSMIVCESRHPFPPKLMGPVHEAIPTSGEWIWLVGL